MCGIDWNCERVDATIGWYFICQERNSDDCGEIFQIECKNCTFSVEKNFTIVHLGTISQKKECSLSGIAQISSPPWG